MINVHQVHDVFLNIQGISIFRMLQTPIVDYVCHIQNISTSNKTRKTTINSHISTKCALINILNSNLRCLQYSHRWVEALAKYVLFVDLPFLFTNCIQFYSRTEFNYFLCKQNCTKWIRELCLKMLFKWIFIQDLRKLIEETKQKFNKNN